MTITSAQGDERQIRLGLRLSFSSSAKPVRGTRAFFLK